ncbi:MFS transporter [Vibrio parahaemolyticus]|uniref:MFS transporter n=1 Tax=Vibrio parahaemolyticus TaxID=670 RepID=UPI001A18A368|nr:MFS transporter [Vibrio parahaemolyticus]MBO0177026.1 MFS transporter [Vibrio parahaemolyticus]MDF4288616.1 MFS transporter [Vibrio parahaemolyticus]MDF4303011.1 MFS transporter [Vibrio parahaemolyticus]MDF5288665.1 MFS transporter [Vibrio parahaemolyticus]MDF5293841.1 MFS transporter [Vibrio parahaemolyticus]
MKNKTQPYLAGRFFDSISSGLFMMALPWVMLSEPKMGTFVALVSLSCTAISFLTTPFFSTLVDRHSRKALLVLNQWIQSGMALVVFIAYWLGFESHWLLAFAQLVYWVSSNFAWTTNNAFTQENYQHHEYAKISGQQEIVMQSTTLGAGALGIVLLEMWGMKEFALFAASASALAAMFYILTPYTQQLRGAKSVAFIAQLKESKQIFRLEPRFYGFILLSCISGDWFAGFNISFGLGSLLTGFIVTKVLSRASHSHIMFASMVMVSLAFIGMSFAISPLTILLFTALFGVFDALNRIARVNWMHHTVAVHQRGRVDGGISMFATTIQSLSYVLIAMLSHYELTQYGFAIAAVVMVLAVVLMGLLSRDVEPFNDLPLHAAAK